MSLHVARLQFSTWEEWNVGDERFEVEIFWTLIGNKSTRRAFNPAHLVTWASLQVQLHDVCSFKNVQECPKQSFQHLQGQEKTLPGFSWVKQYNRPIYQHSPVQLLNYCVLHAYCSVSCDECTRVLPRKQLQLLCMPLGEITICLFPHLDLPISGRQL